MKGVHINRLIMENGPDVIIESKIEYTCIVIDVAIPGDRNITQMEAEKKLKYKNSCIEVQRIRNITCSV
jgi:hypothetical protein